jgi:hypothetical protein
LLSAAVLAHEVALVHLFTIIHWTHFAALVIALALLGFGASGSAVAVAAGRGALEGRERSAFVIATALAALAFYPTVRLATTIPFDAFELIAVPRQILYLALTWIVLGTPFFFAGTAVTLAFLIAPDRIGRVYAANLAGSGAGSLLGLALVATLPAGRLPAAVGGIAGLAVLPLLRGHGVHRLPVAVAALAAIAFVFLPPAPIPMSIYKEERLALELPGATVLARQDGPLGRLDVVGAPALRYLPGTSLALDRPVPARPVLYLNGEPLGPRALAADTSLLTQTTAAVAFATGRGEPAEVLILGLAGGASIHLARASGAARITVVDPDRRIDHLLAPGTLGPDVRRSTTGARAFLHATGRRYDRILIAEAGSLHAAAGGMAAAGASYLFTVEGMGDLWDRLGEDGILAITRWAVQPPREVPRLLATLRAVMDARGLPSGPRVVLVRSWGTAAVLASPRPFGPEEVLRLERWARARSFDVAWAPGIGESAANRYNVLEPDWFRISAEGLLGAAPDRFLARYPFAVAAVTDEAPFYHHFLPFGRLLELWRTGGRLALPYLEWGLVAQALVLVQAVPISAFLILLPLFFLPRQAARQGRAGGRRARFVYFALLGLAFMLLEVSTIQRLLLFLAEPATATAVVLAAFMVFAGVGSLTAGRRPDRLPSPWLPFLAIAALAPLTWLGGQVLWGVFGAAPLPARMSLALALLAPLAFCMGMPFPLGLQRVADSGPEWIPWCWGVNGFLSVVGATAAPLLALAIGFRGVLFLAAGLYLLAGWTLRRL